MRSMRFITGVAVVCGFVWLSGCGDSSQSQAASGGGGAAGFTGEASGGTGGMGSGGMTADLGGALTGILAPVDVFVDPIAGDDDAAGTKSAPLHTLKRALSLAVEGQTIWLEDGTYSKESGEDWSAKLPDGVTVAAITLGNVVLKGDGNGHGVRFAGSGKIQGLRIEGFGIGIDAHSGSQTVLWTSLAQNSWGLAVDGSADMQATGLDIQVDTVGIRADGDALLSIDGGSLSGNADANDDGQCGNSRICDVSSGAVVALENVEISNIAGEIDVPGGDLTLKGCVVKHVGPGACGWGALASVVDGGKLTVEDTFISKIRGDGAFAVKGASLTLAAGTVVLSGAAHRVVDLMDTEAVVQVDSTYIQGASSGTAFLSLGTLTITNAVMQKLSTALAVDEGSVTLRGTSFKECGTAVHLTNGSLDAGTAASPGGNVFGGTTQTALDIKTDQPLPIQASGNTWHPEVQGSGKYGLYPIGKTILGPYGCGDDTPRNLCVAKVGASIAF